MEVTDELVEKLAHLSKLNFNEREKAGIVKDLQNMITFVEKLNELELNDVEPLLHMTDGVNVLRDDVIKGSVSKEAALRNAPATDGNFFLVPKVIKK